MNAAEKQEKQRQWKHMCETAPHAAYLVDRFSFVRHMQEVREKLVGKAPSKSEIERALDATK